MKFISFEANKYLEKALNTIDIRKPVVVRREVKEERGRLSVGRRQ